MNCYQTPSRFTVALTPYNSDISVLKLVARLFGHINQRRKRQFILLLVLTLFGSLAEVISIGSVFPFISVLTQPEQVFESPYFSRINQYFNIQSPQELVLPLCGFFAITAVIAASMRLILLWVGINLGKAIGVDLGVKVFERTLYQPYHVNISRNSSEIISAITLKVAAATNIMVSAVTVVIAAILFIFIICLLLVTNPVIAMAAAFSFGGAYWAIAWWTQEKLSRNSNEIATQQTNVVKGLQEGMGAIRDITIDGTQSVYLNLYHDAVLKLQRATAENTFINQSPRYMMEGIGIVLIALLALLFSYSTEGVSSALPILAMLALGAQRLLPVLQQLYGNWSVLKGNTVPLAETLTLLDQDLPDFSNEKSGQLAFRKSVRLEKVCFRYEPTGPLTIDNFDLEIPKGSRVGIVGTTGCGKSTLLDLLMGLLDPVSGQIKIDSTVLSDNNLRNWRSKIAHVPQNIFLSDSSIAENIAFGVTPDAINMTRVRATAKQARIAEYIESRPTGYETRIGEKGIFLSGGQRQRVGIARALYKQAELLILDEATSALDTDTEESVMMAIEGLSNDLTILIVAHRLSTLKKCDFIVEINSGRVGRVGPYCTFSI